MVIFIKGRYDGLEYASLVLCCPTKSFQPSRASTQYRLIPAHCHLRDFVILRLYIKSKPAGCPLLQESGSLEFPSWSTKLVNNDFVTAKNQKLPNPNNQKTSKPQPLSNTVGSFILFYLRNFQKFYIFENDRRVLHSKRLEMNGFRVQDTERNIFTSSRLKLKNILELKFNPSSNRRS